MIPSLVATEIRDGLVEYLTSTFALADPEASEALGQFLTDEADGIFRGPFLTIRTPFQPAPATGTPPLEWMPPGFIPYQHQASAFERLTTANGHKPQPTIVTTGTGSGKTECFLLPILDHCRRMRLAGQKGIKAVLLYPMNALAADQAGRLAKTLAADPELAGVTAGMYVGGQGKHTDLTADHLIDKREQLRADPPDILLTNYKMLDFLLLRSEDHDLWARNQPDTLRYVVLDEFHTYNGAQGTDVAMLLRRLGATLGMAQPGRPLGGAAPVATSATLGARPTGTQELRDFAAKVFGARFEPDSVIGETRQTEGEALAGAAGGVEALVPDPTEVAHLEDPDVIAAAFGVAPGSGTSSDSPSDLGKRLLAHPLTGHVLRAASNTSRSWVEVVNTIVSYTPEWADAASNDPELVEATLARYLSLLSIARRANERPLFGIEVQLWIREVSRVQRTITSGRPSFRWRDSAASLSTDTSPQNPTPELPAVYCRKCGASGWMALRSEATTIFSVEGDQIRRAALHRSPLIRTLIKANPNDPLAIYYSPGDRAITAPGPDTVAVLMSDSDEDATAQRCPSCTEPDAIRFLGLAVASLASVSINTLFGSTRVEAEERKLLAFTDSVQDASHRASFFAGRTHRMNLRALMSRVIQDRGSMPLAELADEIWRESTTDADRFGLIPPDLLKHPAIRTVWTDTPKPGANDLLVSRLGFETDLEFGLRSRVGRTLELAGVAVAAVDPERYIQLTDLVAEIVDETSGQTPNLDAVAVYLRGLTERLRLKGGIHHRLLEPFVANNGQSWWIWGGRPDGLPPFTPNQGRPSFFTTATKTEFDSVTATPKTPTWLIDWAQRTLGLASAHAATVNTRVVRLLATDGHQLLVLTNSNRAETYGLDRRAVTVTSTVDVPPEITSIQCHLCGRIHVVTPDRVAEWVGSACLRYRCTGTFTSVLPPEKSYYRDLFASGITRRVVTAEHTGMLGRSEREALEHSFRDGTAPDAPNVVTATPTLEMGIDIGDLSAVMLTSVPRNPAAYTQRVGRAGRASGNALVTTFVRTDTHGLYYLAEPQAMISGDVRPPNCYLDAIESLQRQYVAYLFDRLADRSIDGPALPTRISQLVKGGFAQGAPLRAITDASADPTHVAKFLALFGDEINDETTDRLTTYASGLEPALKAAIGVWQNQLTQLEKRRDRLKTAIRDAESKPTSTNDVVAAAQLKDLEGQRRVIIGLLTHHRDEYVLSALERLGVLPNYTLIDDPVVLTASLWSADDDGDFHTERIEYRRPGRRAIVELAPGNSFYAAGHRHYIDSLDVGTADAPLYETWRLCPDCSYGTIDVGPDSLASCPRCGTTEIADTGSCHTVLRLKAVGAAGSEEGARVFDETDERRRERYNTIDLIDVDPASISGGWELATRSFGAELDGIAHVRTFNTGLAHRPGQQTLPIAGDAQPVGRFTTCAHCGAVREARDDRKGQEAERLHHGWCRVRAGTVAEEWEPLILLHQLDTEAVRMLIPVSMFQIAERLASFTGVLRLGLREDFGGDPEHLEIAYSSGPNRSGQGRRQFLVLFDSIPGGTGYLARLADPERLRTILEKGRDVVARCQCSTEGRQACHRCLLGAVQRFEYDLVRRDIALSIVDDLLADWTHHPIDSVASIDIGQVEESELERRFKDALENWAEKFPDDAVSWTRVPGNQGRPAFELKINIGQFRVRYRIDEQEPASGVATVPDFTIRRLDKQQQAPIAVYLDGFEFHASAQHNRLANDAAKRRALRQAGYRVWSLAWDDVDQFHEAVLSATPKNPGPREMLIGAAKVPAEARHAKRGGGTNLERIGLNPMALLLDYLSRPNDADFSEMALSAVAGIATAGQQSYISSAGVLATLVNEAEGHAPPASASGRDVLLSHYRTHNGLAISCYIPTATVNNEAWTVVVALPDAPGDLSDEAHSRRWHDWLQWSNLLQFLTSLNRAAVICTRSEAHDYPWNDLLIVAPPASPHTPTQPAAGAPGSRQAAPVQLSQSQLELLDELLDPGATKLARAILEAGGPLFEVGTEIDGASTDAAWPGPKVAILFDDDDALASGGWDARPASGWDVDELLQKLQRSD